MKFSIEIIEIFTHHLIQNYRLGASSPALLKLLDANEIPNGRALVPGCGRGYDVVALASKDRKAIGSEY